jgi:asparagine synthase (glutamine-hydrolysing)
MCGIAAFIRHPNAPADASIIEEMTRAVRHRGPDGHGCSYFNQGPDGVHETLPGQSWGVALGHRRLSILDLSEAGRQPMAYRDRLWLTYNGEVYNYVELRRELEQLGYRFRSQSDTEVVLAAYDAWGTDCFARFQGMWGLILLDGRRRVAVLCRDRLGIKPLYLCVGPAGVALASEIKQLLNVPRLRLRPDLSVLRGYLLTGYEQPDRTFFERVRPIPAGCWQSIDLDTRQVSAPQPYWFPERVQVSIHDSIGAARAFREELEKSVELHLRSDVPVGCALSGGLDSSSVAGCIARRQEEGGIALQTFSVVFPGSSIDECWYAEQVVRSVGARPHFTTPTAEQFLEDCDRFIWVHDEPVGSLSQYAGFALARLTRAAGVPVTLNGQGGDEVLGGYWQSLFVYLRGLAWRGRWLELAGHLLGACSARGNPELLRQVPMMLRRYRARTNAVQSLRLSSLDNPGPDGPRNRISRLVAMAEPERRVYEIRHMYLPRLLKWDDRNFMAFGVEGRYPFLDHRLIEVALSFAPRTLYANGWTKEPLRRGLGGMLPEAVLRRRSKFGFETPQEEWLRGPLRPALRDWLDSESPLWDIVQPQEARDLAEAVWQGHGRGDERGQALFRLYIADRWMRLFFR